VTIKDIIHKRRTTDLFLSNMNNCLRKMQDTLIKFTFKRSEIYSYINQMIDVEGECCRASTILIAVSTHCHLIPSKTLSSSKFKHQILNQPQLVFRGKDIYNSYIKYTFSVNDHSCIGSTLKVLNFNHDLMTGERFSFMT